MPRAATQRTVTQMNNSSSSTGQEGNLRDAGLDGLKSLTSGKPLRLFSSMRDLAVDFSYSSPWEARGSARD